MSAPERPECGKCGRLLTDPASIARGHGPKCAVDVGLTPATAVRRPRAAARGPDLGEPIPGQVEIPLNHQPTLWSTP